MTENSVDDLLTFQDFAPVHGNQQASTEIQIGDSPKKQVDFSDLSSSNFGEGNVDGSEESSKQHSLWSLQYYQLLFDVDTSDVIERIRSSVNPAQSGRLYRIIKMKPDLYGPVWISITLIFAIAISGNIANYLQYADKYWKYDFHLVSYAASAIFVYVVVVPVILWAFLKWSNKDQEDEMDFESETTLLELICTYGYSLFIYVPASILWTIQISIVQWFLLILASSLSGYVLLKTLKPSVQKSRHRLFLIVAILGLHLLLATGFMLYFFHVPNVHVNTPIIEHKNKTD